MKRVWLVLMFASAAFGVLRAEQKTIDFSAAAAAAEQQVPAPSATAAAAAAGVDAELVRARLNYDKFTLIHAQRTFEWQFWSGIVVFIVVMTTVVVGLRLSYLHFRAWRGGEMNQLKMSASGIEVSSPVIGLLILTVSLGFFYLYLTQVYPITELKP